MLNEIFEDPQARPLDQNMVEKAPTIALIRMLYQIINELENRMKEDDLEVLRLGYERIRV